ncbi:hypothetical protein SDC9_96034 [bioreactor metagenome]|uniref:Uncharacterized protein n=1 Tax=bioreactor metagenome TaxID=1076179 RepID=A0A645A7Z5_9ZZZZ
MGIVSAGVAHSINFGDRHFGPFEVIGVLLNFEGVHIGPQHDGLAGAAGVKRCGKGLFRDHGNRKSQLLHFILRKAGSEVLKAAKLRMLVQRTAQGYHALLGRFDLSDDGLCIEHITYLPLPWHHRQTASTPCSRAQVPAHQCQSAPCGSQP